MFIAQVKKFVSISKIWGALMFRFVNVKLFHENDGRKMVGIQSRLLFVFVLHALLLGTINPDFQLR